MNSLSLLTLINFLFRLILIVSSVSICQAKDCSQADIQLRSQEEVDSFQAAFGGGAVCDTVIGSLKIGWDEPFSGIQNLDGLKDLARIDGSLLFTFNLNLSDIGGLSSLSHVGGDLYFNNYNPSLLNLDGLSALHQVGGDIVLSGQNTPAFQSHLQNIDGLESLQQVGGSIRIDGNFYLKNMDGLRSISEIVVDLQVTRNISLANIDGLSSLSRVGGALTVSEQGNLIDLNGLSSLTSVGDWLVVSKNGSLGNLDGLSSIKDVMSLEISSNKLLGDCMGVTRLIDMFDDYEEGPAHQPIPDVESDVVILKNAKGCNSIDEILGSAPLDEFNPGVNDAWFNPETDGQGFLINVYPSIGQLFLAWFTYDVERPQTDATAILGDPGHRWLTAQGAYAGNEALLDLWLTSGGIFDSSEPSPKWQQDGEIFLELSTCNSGIIHYDITSLGMEDLIPIERITLDNVALCYKLNMIRDTSSEKLEH